MTDTIRIKEEDLVLKVSNNVDINKWDETKYYKFLDQLCGNREYQKEAILTALKFMCGGEIENTKQLAYYNFESNENFRSKYFTFNNLEKKLPFPNNFTASLDLATGTGKSWVLYAVAIILLIEKKVDQVLVLVPSITIESELTNKFKTFATDNTYATLLNNFVPKIINGSESIIEGSICIENRDAIYNNTRSSIIDSLKNKGSRTLVLSDEVHHVYYSEENKWKEFISKINFKYNLGVSGTCYYKDGDYFSNVIYRYSLKKAIEDDRVKQVEYIAEENIPSKSEEKWQVIYNSHEDIKNQLGFLPLTVVVADTIRNCKKIANEFKKILSEKYNLSHEEIDDKVLVIHSQSDAAGDRLRLKSVDEIGNKVEWIFSVSMLTEGWDVKRVFQIVPHEERAFNSKLLIAQVLGRGLRVPNNWNYQEKGKPKVIIFNHAKWSSSVKKLVEEILEIEKRLISRIDLESIYNFNLINVSYKSTPKRLETKKEGKYKLFDKGYIDLPTDEEIHTISAGFVNVTDSSIRDWNTKIKYRTYTIKEIAQSMFDRFNDIPDDKNEGLTKKYQNEWTIEKLEKMINESLIKSGNKVITNKLKQRFLSSMGTAFRQGNAVVDYNMKPSIFDKITTKNIRNTSVSASSLKKDKILFWSPNTIKFLNDEEILFFNEIKDNTNGYKQFETLNIYNFKTPQTSVIADSTPERDFIKKIVSGDVSRIEKWIKSSSTGFYPIEYTWRKGEHPKNGLFNPDFFLVVDNRILVVEVKDDNQINNPDPENIGKHKAALNHFKTINNYIKKNELSEPKYKFTMLTPSDFEVFFNKIELGDIDQLDNFKSSLDVTLMGK